MSSDSSCQSMIDTDDSIPDPIDAIGAGIAPTLQNYYNFFNQGECKECPVFDPCFRIKTLTHTDIGAFTVMVQCPLVVYDISHTTVNQSGFTEENKAKTVD